jgi:DNA-binding NarL/FixJ family response regulator
VPILPNHRPHRVLLVDDSPLFLESAANLLAIFPELEIVGRALSGRAALEQTAALAPDLVLMDLAMPAMNGLQATRLIKAQPNPPRVVIVTLHDDLDYRAAAEVVGADGFIVKSNFASELVLLVGRLFAGPPGLHGAEPDRKRSDGKR